MAAIISCLWITFNNSDNGCYIWKSMHIHTFNKIIVLCVNLLQKRRSIGKDNVIDDVIIESYANANKRKGDDARWGYDCNGFTFGYKMLTLIEKINFTLI